MPTPDIVQSQSLQQNDGVRPHRRPSARSHHCAARVRSQHFLFMVQTVGSYRAWGAPRGRHVLTHVSAALRRPGGAAGGCTDNTSSPLLFFADARRLSPCQHQLPRDGRGMRRGGAAGLIHTRRHLRPPNGAFRRRASAAARGSSALQPKCWFQHFPRTHTYEITIQLQLATC